MNWNDHEKTKASNEIIEHCHSHFEKKVANVYEMHKNRISIFSNRYLIQRQEDCQRTKLLTLSNVCCLGAVVYYHVYGLYDKGIFLRNIISTSRYICNKLKSFMFIPL